MMTIMRNHPRPDVRRFIQCLRRLPTDRPVLYEHYVEWPHLHRQLGADAVDADAPAHGWVVNAMHALARMGHDVYAVPVAHLGAKRLMYPLGDRGHGASVSQNVGAMITDRASFDAYAWPDPDADPYERILDGIAEHAPAGMGLVADLQGAYDLTVDLIGFERLCVLLADDPGLVADVLARIGAIQLRAAERLLAHPLVVGVEVCDDWGHRTGTSLSPAALRRLVLPHHRRIVEAAHRAGKVAILHACGRVDALMEDVIALGYDAKHQGPGSLGTVADTRA
jgi:uroporphyrinogen decarboxylase